VVAISILAVLVSEVLSNSMIIPADC